MDSCVNDEVDDENKHNLIEENDTKRNDEYEDCTKVNDKELNVATDTESSTSKEINDKNKGEKEVISEKNNMTLVKVKNE